jgi:hypothetical protein
MSRAIRLGVVALTLSCSKSSDKPAPAAVPSESVAAIESTAAPASAAPKAPPPAAFCRALRVTGAAKVGDAELASGGELDGSAWVTLAAGASLTLKHSVTGRELAVSGPAAAAR